MKIKSAYEKIHSYLKELGNLTAIAFIIAVLPIAGSTTLLIFARPLGYWLKANWEIGIPIYLFSIIFFCGLSLLPTNVISFVGGWIFGFYLGIAILMTGIFCASLMSFLIYSRLVGEKLPKIFESHPKADAIYKALVGQSFWRTTLIIFLLRMSPAMPFGLTNFLMASARVPTKSFAIGTFLGMLPRTSAVIFVGSGLSELNFDNPQNSWLLILGIITTIISAIIIGLISKHALERLTKKHQNNLSNENSIP